MSRRVFAFCFVAVMMSPTIAFSQSFLSQYKGLPYHDTSYSGGPQEIPGKVLCAYYDLGGEGVAYHDSDPKNHGSGELNPADGTYLNEFRIHEGVQALCWVNPNAFALESSLGAGQAPIGDIIGPNFYQWDLSLRKTFKLPSREGMRLQFQADAFNAFNRTNWNNPTVNNAGSSTFGQVTGSLPARVLQFGGKFSF